MAPIKHTFEYHHVIIKLDFVFHFLKYYHNKLEWEEQDFLLTMVPLISEAVFAHYNPP